MSETANNNDNTKSISLFLETAKSEYEIEHNRTSIIDSKTSIALPIISAYFLALAEMNDFRNIFKIEIANFSDSILPSCLFITYTAALILTLIAVIMLAKVIMTRDYNVIKPQDIYGTDYITNDVRVLSLKLIDLYITATLHNKEKNDSRIPLYRRSWLFTAISIILFTIYIIIHNTMFGGK